MRGALHEVVLRGRGLVRPFRFTLLALGALPLCLWPFRDGLVRLFFSSVIEQPHYFDHPERVFELGAAPLVLAATALWLLPLAGAEAWLLLCDRMRAQWARSWTVPLALVLGVGQLAAFFLTMWLALPTYRSMLTFAGGAN
ncbi:MAG TPA: hypothetical protein VIM73_08060 [Polyangiaceae bacterium]